MDKTPCLIVGAGLAGLATACELGRRGLTGVVLLEQESRVGVHSSGRNAGMVRQLVADPRLAELGRRGARFFATAKPGIFDPVGSLLLAADRDVTKLETMAGAATEAGVAVELLTPSAARARHPVLQGTRFSLAAWTPSDGTVHIEALLDHLVAEAIAHGARILTDRGVGSIERNAGGFSVNAGGRKFQAARVVNAAGAWADQLAELVGAEKVGLIPYRRHVLRAPAPADLPRDLPFVWNLSHEAYIRPAGDHLMLCACDHEPDTPGPAEATDGHIPALRAVVEDAFPQIRCPGLGDHWAGHRTFAPDGGFVLGADPAIDGFFWAAALGGHGLTASAAVGEIVADAVLQSIGEPSAATR